MQQLYINMILRNRDELGKVGFIFSGGGGDGGSLSSDGILFNGCLYPVMLEVSEDFQHAHVRLASTRFINITYLFRDII